MKHKKHIHQWINKEISDEKALKTQTSESFDKLKKITHYAKHIYVPKVDTAIALQQFNHIKKSKKKRNIRLKTYYTVAASILLLLVPAFYFLMIKSNTVFNTLVAETKSFTLPDNSKVMLNANSNLIYTKYFWNKNRKITLRGEAYFKVTKGETFTVITTSGQVQVLGTQFNVKERKNAFEVSCYEGSVKVDYLNTQKKLLAGDVLKIILNKKTVTAKSKRMNPSWIHKESSFKNAPLWEVLLELKQYYPVDFVLEKINTQQLYTGTFTHTNIDVALQTITTPLKIKYTKKGRKIMLTNEE